MSRHKLDTIDILVKVANVVIVKKSIRMLKDVKIKILGHKIRHTFITMDFFQAMHNL